MEQKKQIRTSDTDFTSDGNKICGYASVYNSDSEDMGWYDTHFYERIAPGAFDSVLAKGDDVRCLQDHLSDKILGRTKSGTLTLKADEKGLYFECECDENITWHKDLLQSIKRGDISQCSFAFIPKDTTTDYDKDTKTYIRTIKSFDRLFDVSVVTYPAYPDTEAYVREFIETEQAKEKEKLEAEIREKEENENVLTKAKALSLL